MSEIVLAMFLDGPMQAWGSQSRFERRTSHSYPTRSGVTGILCAAMGIDRADRETLARLARLRMEIVTLQGCARLKDYHTVGGGYDSKQDRLSMPRLANAGSPRTIVTEREYLVDAKFGVLLSGEPDLLRQCSEALRDPVWGLWLGRKCCIPASPIGQGVFENRDEAVTHLKTLASSKSAADVQLRRTIVEVDSFDEGTDTIMDLPVCFASREFLPRRVRNEPEPEE